ncbi:hypothetical protein HS088_TW21G01446 [Tripterygium wilfordii]|uniref:Uncharacterized protein n=1 Tax=Tripterygium wilfordii TaxID=458696 RepID=A0A7J7C577_TRIWF|nr:hypothetical protein HS088_TW21G01446 [Tripterygium wilfordii]
MYNFTSFNSLNPSLNSSIRYGIRNSDGPGRLLRAVDFDHDHWRALECARTTTVQSRATEPRVPAAGAGGIAGDERILQSVVTRRGIAERNEFIQFDALDDRRWRWRWRRRKGSREARAGGCELGVWGHRCDVIGCFHINLSV